MKALNYGSDIKFYYVNFEDGKFTTDGLIDMPVPELSEDRFCTITVPEMAEGTYIGIRGNSVLIDNVTATTAEVTPLPRMKVLKVSDGNPEYVDAASDGNFTLNYSVQLRNNGQRDLKVGDENYSLSLVNTTLNNRVVGTTAMTEDLALGAETTATLTVTPALRFLSQELCLRRPRQPHGRAHALWRAPGLSLRARGNDARP